MQRRTWALVVLAGCLAFATVAAQTTRPRRPPPVSVNVVLPDTVKVSLGSASVNARIGDTMTVRLADRPPWWDSNAFSAFGGAVIGGLLVIIGEASRARLKRGNVHRSSLARLERMCHDYLNQIITNKRLAGDAQKAGEMTAVFWHLPNPFEIDRSFTLDIIDLDMNKRVAGLNTDLLRYNNDIAHLSRAHDALQTSHLGGTLPLAFWQEAIKAHAVHWGDIAKHLDAIDGLVRDVCVRSYLLVFQYDSRRASLLRFFGLGVIRTWPLNDELVARESREFDSRRERELEEHRQRLIGLHGPRPHLQRKQDQREGEAGPSDALR